MKTVLGIDTSNYTTSLCLLGEDGSIVAEQRRLLEVASGSRGLRQSEALFQHVRNLPVLLEKMQPYLEEHELVAVSASVKPRPQAGSYLPVFLPGSALARCSAILKKIPLYELTHQESHIWSGIASGGGPLGSHFAAIHLSGGTTEMTWVRRNDEDWGLAIDLWGGTSDLHAGQFVDRLGVKLGLKFPAGPALEKMAHCAEGLLPVPASHKDGSVSFSGPLTALERKLGQAPPEALALTCFKVISRTLIKWIEWAEARTGCRELLIVGGVAANRLIRRDLETALPHWELYFAQPRFSVDNACGAAYYCGLKAGFPIFPPQKDGF